jgi:hypothetical protein
MSCQGAKGCHQTGILTWSLGLDLRLVSGSLDLVVRSGAASDEITTI